MTTWQKAYALINLVGICAGLATVAWWITS